MPGLTDRTEESKSLGHLKVPTVFNNLIHAFSLLDFYAELGQKGPAYAATRCKDGSTMAKHLKLLNGLALLLIKQPKSEVAATSFEITPAGATFYWSRNDNESSFTEKAYIERLLTMAKESAEDGEILLSIITFTKDKLLSRMQKALTKKTFNIDKSPLTGERLAKILSLAPSTKPEKFTSDHYPMARHSMALGLPLRMDCLPYEVQVSRLWHS